MIDNNLGWDNAKFFLILAMFGCGAGITVLLLLNDVLGFVIFSTIGIMYPLIVWLRDNIASPNEFEFNDKGFYAHFKFSKSRFINWDDITDITYIPTDPSRFGAVKKGGGQFKVIKSHFPYALKEEVAFLCVIIISRIWADTRRQY